MEQEYIKGDIVMYDNKIHTIMDALGVNNYELSYIEHPVHQLELSEVPLTADILEKNRWKKDDRGYNFRDIIFLNKDSFGGWVVGIGEDYILTIASIHQLQHLLFEKAIDKINQAIFLIKPYFEGNLEAKRFTLKYLQDALKELED